jgi:hypothetical protein
MSIYCHSVSVMGIPHCYDFSKLIMSALRMMEQLCTLPYVRIKDDSTLFPSVSSQCANYSFYLLLFHYIRVPLSQNLERSTNIVNNYTEPDFTGVWYNPNTTQNLLHVPYTECTVQSNNLFHPAQLLQSTEILSPITWQIFGSEPGIFAHRPDTLIPINNRYVTIS